MPNHPFLVWLAHNKDRDRTIRGAWITATRTAYPRDMLNPQTWTFEQLVEFSLTDAHADEHGEIQRDFSRAWEQYEMWLLGLLYDFKEARAHWTGRS